MANYILNVFILILLITSIPRTEASLSAAEKNKIEKGLEAGKALADFLKDGKFRDSLVKLGKNLSPFLGALGPLAGLAIALIPTGDSPELKYMKTEFKKVSNKLDIITSKFEEVKRAIDWNTVKVSYGSYERKIRAAEANLNRIYEVEGKVRDNEKTNFITQYELDFSNSLQKLYDAIMENDHILSMNVLETAVKQMKNHRRKVEQFSLGLVQLLVQGIKVKVSYYGFKKWSADHVTKEWTEKMNKLGKKLEKVSERIKSVYKTQMKTDANDLILRHHGLGNRGLMRKIYNFMVDKYDWRYWFVAVYNDMYTFDKHAISQCGGASILHTQGKNVIISSQDDKYSSKFSKTRAESILRSIDSDIDNCASDTRNAGERARTLVNKARSKGGSSCVPYALMMAVETGNGLWYISFGSHRAFRKISKRKRCCSGRCRTISWRSNMIIFG